MNYGIPLHDIRKSEEFLNYAGYRKIANHFESDFQPDHQWISNADQFKAHFPRFHISKIGKKLFIHYDYFAGDDKRTNIKRCPQTMEEIKRLRQLSNQYASNSNQTPQ